MELSSFLVLVLVLAVLVLIRWIRKPSGRSLPPGPLALPLIGNLPMIDKRAPFKSFMQVREKEGLCVLIVCFAFTALYDSLECGLHEEGSHKRTYCNVHSWWFSMNGINTEKW